MTAKDPFFQRFGRGARFGAAAVCGLALMTVPVLAQFGGFGGYGGGRGGNFDSFFGPFSPPPRQVERPVDYSRAPAPKKLDSQPTGSVLVLGDSMADWLGFGLEDALGETPDLAVVRKNRASSGLIRYDSRNENQDWAQVIREAIAANKPKFIVMMVGLNDRVAIRDRVSSVTTSPAGGSKAAPPPAAAAKPADTPEQSEAKPDASDAEQAPPEQHARRCRGDRFQRALARRRPSSRISLRRMGRVLYQAHRRHDCRTEERGCAGVLGWAAVDPRTEIDQRYGISGRLLSRQRRKSLSLAVP